MDPNRSRKPGRPSGRAFDSSALRHAPVSGEASQRAVNPPPSGTLVSSTRRRTTFEEGSRISACRDGLLSRGPKGQVGSTPTPSASVHYSCAAPASQQMPGLGVDSVGPLHRSNCTPAFHPRVAPPSVERSTPLPRQVTRVSKSKTQVLDALLEKRGIGAGRSGHSPLQGAEACHLVDLREDPRRGSRRGWLVGEVRLQEHGISTDIARSYFHATVQARTQFATTHNSLSRIFRAVTSLSRFIEVEQNQRLIGSIFLRSEHNLSGCGTSSRRRSHVDRIVDVVAAIEDFAPFLLRLEELTKVGDGAVVEVGRAEPEAVKRRRLVTRVLHHVGTIDPQFHRSGFCACRKPGWLISPSSRNRSDRLRESSVFKRSMSP